MHQQYPLRTQMLATHCGVGLGSTFPGQRCVLFIHLTIPKIQRNNPIYGVTMGLRLIASGTSLSLPGAPKKNPKKPTSGLSRSTMVLREKAFTSEADFPAQQST